MTQRSSLRASDADRDRVAERLRQATAEGRLYAHELEERLATALRARTYGELDAVVDDLPGAPVTAMVAKRPGFMELLRRYPLAVAILGAILGVALAGMVAAAIFVAASGIWIIPLVLFIVCRARLLGGRGQGRRRPRLRGYDDGRMEMHTRRRGQY